MTGLLVAVVLGMATPSDGPVRDDAREQDGAIVLRAFGGAGSGIGGEAWLPGSLARLDADVQALWPGELEWGGLAAVIPLAGDRRRFVGLRAGGQLEYTGGHQDGGWRGSRLAEAADVGLVAHLESLRGSAVEVQLGGEALFRESPAICCDNAALRTRSYGLRASVRGDLALSRSWGLFAQAGVRTADHVMEISILPTLSAGVRLRL